MPPTAIQTKRPAADATPTEPPSTTAARTMAKTTAAVPSLNRLSASTIVVSRSGTPSRRNNATTLTGSVAAMSAPKRSATTQVVPPR